MSYLHRPVERLTPVTPPRATRARRVLVTGRCELACLAAGAAASSAPWLLVWLLT